MEFKHTKLTKKEWENIEKKVNPNELTILKLITEGFHNVNHTITNIHSLQYYIKSMDTKSMDLVLFNNFIKKTLYKIYKKYNIERDLNYTIKTKIKKKDSIRLDTITHTINTNKTSIYEFIIIDIITDLVKSYNKNSLKFNKYYYTLSKLIQNSNSINHYLLKEISYLLELYNDKLDIKSIIYNADTYIEKNKYLLNAYNIKLYNHQKEIFSLFKTQQPKLILYSAPTGTGKTLTPLGLSEKYKIIFVCAAKHVGLALAKSAISINKKIALAFNCIDINDIRLHYNSAKVYTKNYKSGGIFKVDNSVGDKVEIMVCDLMSYQTAMMYMLEFNDKEDIIMYWDEPTITMDYETHDYHKIIQYNWKNNIIPNIVLSSATLPESENIENTINNYIERFGGTVHSIQSNDLNNSVSIISKDCYSVLPHHIHKNYEDIIKCMNYCRKKSSTKRYMDLYNIIEFIKYINENNLIPPLYHIGNYFNEINNITVNSIKEYYLLIFNKIKSDDWPTIYDALITREKVFESNIYIATKDAYTLTDGPTIYITNEVAKIAKFCFQTTKISASLLESIEQIIRNNESLNNKIMKLEKSMDKNAEKNQEKKQKDEFTNSLQAQLFALESQIQDVTIPSVYIPNTKNHFNLWNSNKDILDYKNIYKSEICGEDVIKIMRLNVDIIWKILLLVGIGVFNNIDIDYTEIVKEFAEEKKLYLIIASSDYIYGTNYQFSHGYIGKDMTDLTQEKLIQAMGRIGRINSTTNYSIRFRCDAILQKIFEPLDVIVEANNMNKLFC